MKHFTPLLFFYFALNLSGYTQIAPGVEWERCLPNSSVRAAVAISDSLFTIAYDLKSCSDSSAVGLRGYTRNGSMLWEKIIAPPASESYHVFSLSKTPDHGYIFSGSRDSATSNFNWLVKTDSTGEILWEKHFFFNDTAKTLYGKALSLDDGNYILITDTYSTLRRDVWVLKLDASGNILWQKSYGDTLFDYARDVVTSIDGGVLIAAYTSSSGVNVSGNHGANDIWLIELDNSGEIEWQKCYGGTMNEEVRSVVKLEDGYLICGMSQSNDGDVTGHHGSTTYYDDWIFRINEAGGVIWEKSFGGENHDCASQMIPLSDGNFLVTGSSYSTNGNITDHHGSSIYDDQWTLKIDDAGNVIWAKSTGGSGDDWGICITALDFDNLIIAGASIADDGDHQNACYANDCYVIEGGWIVKLNASCTSFPTALFSFSQNGKTLSFTNVSSNAQSYLWDFGDGNFSSEQNPVHTYTFNGAYTVCLTAYDSCTSQTYCATISTCTGVPNALFIVSYPGGTDVQFTDLSSNAAQWNWDFGDGDTDIVKNPLHLYSQNGTYIVVLTVMDSCGQSDVTSVTINTCNGFHADFSYTVNANTISFSDQSVGLPNSWSWNFGDGDTSQSQNPVHTYADGGTYNVCLTVTTDGCSSQSICKMISVCDPVELDSFTYNADANHLSFFDASQDATDWSWDFGDGNFSFQQNPEYTFTQAGIYTVCEVVSNSCNSDTLCVDISVQCPPFAAGFTFVQSIDTVWFTDQSLNAGQWQWDFGDGALSDAENPFHIYSDIGTYNVCLIARDSCSSDTFCVEITIECPPFAAGFTFVQSIDTLWFTDQSLNSVQWQWDFGDGGFSSAENPLYVYADTGTYNVCLVAWDSCSSDTFCVEINIECPPFAAGFTFVQSSDTAWFTDQSLNAVQWQWDFGDGGFSDAENPLHIYASPGTYTVCLIAWDGCSADTFCEIIHVIPDGINMQINSEGQFELYPNPASGQVRVVFTLANSLNVSIILEDVDGKMLKEMADEAFSAGTHTLRLDVSSLSSGIYLLKKIDPTGVVIRKLIIQ